MLLEKMRHDFRSLLVTRRQDGDQRRESLWLSYESGQISERQWMEHLDADPTLEAFCRSSSRPGRPAVSDPACRFAFSA